MSERNFRRQLDGLGGKIIYIFENEFAEKFFIYTIEPTEGMKFISGDEFDWELGWELQRRPDNRHIAVSTFSFSEYEQRALWKSQDE